MIEYACKKCEKKFKLNMTISEHDKKQACPNCGSRYIEQKITTFNVQTKRKS